MSRWFRHYAGMMRDDKLVRAALKAKQSIERTVWVWGAILESASEIDSDGRYEIDSAEIAHFLRCKPAHIDAIIEALQNLGRIDGETVSTWSKRQFKSDRSNERVAEYRAKKRAKRNGDVTLQERHGNSPETETETDTPFSNENGPAVVDEIIDPSKVMFDAGVGLITQSGKSQSTARAWLAKARKEHGTEAVITAIGAAKREGAVEPISFMEASLRGRARASASASSFSGVC